MLLDTIHDRRCMQWKTELARLCAIRLISLELDADVMIDHDSFEPWIDDVNKTTSEFDEVMAEWRLSRASNVRRTGAYRH